MNLKKPQSRAYQPHTTCPQSDVLLCAAAHCPREVPAHKICPEDSHRTPPCRPRPSMLKLCWIHKIAFCFVYLRFSFGTFAQNPSLILLDFTVAPLAGSVDRNLLWSNACLLGRRVAPLAGSVDRNSEARMRGLLTTAVAPLAGSVDRNLADQCVEKKHTGRSPCGERG